MQFLAKEVADQYENKIKEKAEALEIKEKELDAEELRIRAEELRVKDKELEVKDKELEVAGKENIILKILLHVVQMKSPDLFTELGVNLSDFL